MLSLKTTLLMNACSCLIFGGIFAGFPRQVAVFLGGSTPAPQLVMLLLGGVLVVNGIHLVWAAHRHQPGRLLIRYFSLGDFLWVAASAVLLLCGWWITTIEGQVASLLVALMVGGLGLIQWQKSHNLP